MNLIFIYSKCLSLQSVIFEKECPGLSRTVVLFIFRHDVVVIGLLFTQSTGISITGLVTNSTRQYLGHWALSQLLSCKLILATTIITKTKMKSINRWMDKEDVVQVYNGILLRHKKERNWVIFREVFGHRECHTEWSKSEKEKQIYINAYMWNLEKWYRWNGL